MKYKIEKGKHRARPLKLGLYFNRKLFRRTVLFTDSCRYILPGYDQQDANKLFGVGYFFSHHVDSARFGWFYDPSKKKISVVAYCYVNGERINQFICDVDLGAAFDFELKIMEGFYSFSVFNQFGEIETKFVNYTHKKKIQFPLNLYFGGNNPAPQLIEVFINN